ncbi:MAG: hypothetical protein IKK11_07710, partial [Oscillospiraceae bacterium]|nr:hypothetical protein [Oscillospiraceae bacterium]
VSVAAETHRCCRRNALPGTEMACVVVLAAVVDCGAPDKMMAHPPGCGGESRPAGVCSGYT